jgi:hypothetical protein
VYAQAPTHTISALSFLSQYTDSDEDGDGDELDPADAKQDGGSTGGNEAATFTGSHGADDGVDGMDCGLPSESGEEEESGNRTQTRTAEQSAGRICTTTSARCPVPAAEEALLRQVDAAAERVVEIFGDQAQTAIAKVSLIMTCILRLPVDSDSICYTAQLNDGRALRCAFLRSTHTQHALFLVRRHNKHFVPITTCPLLLYSMITILVTD